ncbi:MAG: right-handed parallel beta-helix repeat-containing protein [Parcubacteria group bacterium]|jgi:hypothetical protein
MQKHSEKLLCSSGASKFKFKIIFLVIIFCGFFGLSAKASAATYYVKNGGNDSLSGLDDANAWETIDKVSSSATSGDTVYFRSQDTWTGADPVLNCTEGVIYDGATYGSGTRAKLQATSRVAGYGVVQIYTSNVTFRGFLVDSNELSLGGVYIGGTSPTPSGDITDITVDYCEIINGITTDSPNPSYYYAILVGARGSHTTSNVTVTNNIVHEAGHEGIAVYPNWGVAGNRVNMALVRGNTVYDVGQAGGSTHPIDIGNDSDNITIEYNTVSGSAIAVLNYGPDYTGPDEYPDNFIIRHNLMQGTGFSTSGYFDFPHFYGSGAFYGNILIDASIALSGIDYHDKSIKMYNNTIYSPGSTSMFGCAGIYEGGSNASGIEFRNNIYYCDLAARCFYDYGAQLTTSQHTNNIYYRPSAGALAWTQNSTYTSANIGDWEPTAQNTDPQFTGGTLPTGFTGTYGSNMLPNTNYFATTAGPTINTGATLGSPFNSSINSAGLASPFLRPVGAYDIGAYEYQGADTTAPGAPSGLAVE